MKKIKIQDTCLIRTNHFPTNDLLDFYKNTSLLLEKFKKDQLFNIGLKISSESFYNSYISNEQLTPKLRKTFISYLIRSTSRCTPHNVYSDVGIVYFCNKTNLTKNSKSSKYYLWDYAADSLSNDSIQILYANPTIYQQSNRYKFYHFKGKHVEIREFDYSKLLELILLKTKTIIRKKSLITSIIKSFDYESTDIEELLDNLIEQQVIYTSNSSFCIPSTYINSNNVPAYQTLSKDELIRTIEQTKSKTLSIDTKIEYSNNKISGTVKTKLIRTINALLNIPPNKNEDENLKIFKEFFLNKYGERKVSLLELFDINNCPVPPYLEPVNELGLDILNNVKNSYSKPFELTKKHIVNSLLSMNQNQYNNICLEDFFNTNGIDLHPPSTEDLPYSFNALVELFDDDNFYLKEIGGIDGNKLLNRFRYMFEEAHAHLHNIEKKMMILNRQVIAEVNYVPTLKHRGVIPSSCNLPYQITFTYPSLKNESIPINDLLIYVENDKVVLFSKSLNATIIPSIPNAFNYSSLNIPILNLIADIEGQGKRGYLGITFDNLNLNRYPRITYEEIVLSPEKWVINTKMFHTDLRNINDFKTTFAKIKSKLSIPKLIHLVVFDQELLLDTTHSDCLYIIRDELMKRTEITLRESYNFKTQHVKNENGDYFNNEVLITICNEN